MYDFRSIYDKSVEKIRSAFVEFLLFEGCCRVQRKSSVFHSFETSPDGGELAIASAGARDEFSGG